MEDEFDRAVLEELEAVDRIIKDRRKQLILSFSPSMKNMGKMFALGAIDSALWRLVLRAKGDKLDV